MGTVDGALRFERLLAVGGIGEVYEATLDGQRVAVKTLLPTFKNVDEAVQRMEREAKAGGLLDHINIIDVIAYGVLADGAPYLAMELVLGTDLAKLIEQGPLAAAHAIAIAKQMLDGIAHAHSRGVLHRDLKPANVMLVGDVVKILDFGLAKLVGLANANEAKLTQTGAIFGTPTYMAPEQVLARPPTAATDQYAAALILFEMLTGRPPFVGADVQATLRLQAAAPAPPLRMHPTLDAIVARALQKAPEARFASALEMRAALDTIRSI